MKLIFITFLLFTITVKSQDYQLNNVPVSNMYKGPIELINTININLETSDTLNTPLNQKGAEKNNNTQHTIHPPKMALTLDEFQMLLLTEKSILNTERKDTTKNPFSNKIIH